MAKRLFYSLRTRLIIFVLLAALPALGLTLYTGLEQRKHATLAAQAEVLRLAQLATANQEFFVRSTREFLLALSHLLALQLNNMESCQDLFSHLLQEHYPFYSTFYVADLNYHIVCQAPNTHIPDDLRQCKHYKQLVEAHDFTISDYHICGATGKAILSMGYPVFEPDTDKVSMVITVSLDMAWINDLAADAQLPEGATLTVSNREGLIVAHYPASQDWVGKTLPDDSILRQLQQSGEGTAIGRSLDGDTLLFAMSTMAAPKDPVYVTLGLPPAIAYAEANRTLSRNLLLIGLVTLMALAAAWFLGDFFILRQTQALVNTTQRLAAGDLQARTAMPYEQGELGQLAQAFDQMAVALGERETERDRAEQAMKEYADELERSNQELRDFTNIASHDMQEPLRKIRTFSELLSTRYKEALDTRGQEYLERIDTAAHRMHSLILDLLTYSRVTTRAMPFVPVNLTDVAHQAIADLDWQIEESQGEIELGELPTIEADPRQIQQVLQNLIGNALKFHKSGQPPRIAIYSQALEGNRRCQICVQDAGIGFDEKYLDRIFQPFERLHTRGNYEGTGMGLAICRKIIERHNGTITARSQPGEGATFIIELPVRQKTGGRK